MAHRPLAIGLTVCETVIVDVETRNATLVNCFSRRGVTAEPSEPLSFFVCATLTDGVGDMPLVVQVLRLDTLDPIFEREVSIHLPAPLAELHVHLRVRHCVFPHAGPYNVALLADGEMIAQRRLQIYLREVD